MKLFILLLALTVLFLENQAFSRKLNASNSSIIILEESNDIQITGNGTRINIVEYRYKIVNSDALGNNSIIEIEYDPQYEKYAFLGGHIKNGVVTTKISTNDVIVRESSSNSLGKNKKLVIVPRNLKVGSVVTYKLKKTTIKSIYKNNIFYFNFGRNGFVKKSTIKVSSPFPLKTYLNNPYNAIKFKEYKKDMFVYRASIDQDYVELSIDEESSYYDEENSSYLYFYEDYDLDNYLEFIRSKYESIISKEIPSSFLDKINNKKLEGIELIYSYISTINQEIKYINDYRKSDSDFVPKSFQEVWDRKAGDCKDFASILIKLLRLKGYKAYPALVHRDKYYSIQHSNPYVNLENANHVIVYAKKDKKEYFIDPTNDIPVKHLVRSDIEDRYTIVLTPKISHLKTPIQKSNMNIMHRSSSVWPAYNKRDLNVEMKINFKGESAFDMFLEHHNYKEDAAWLSIKKNMLSIDNLVKFKALSSLPQSYENELSYHFKFSLLNEIISDGNMLFLKAKSLLLKSLLTIEPANRYGSFYISHKGKWIEEVQFRGIKPYEKPSNYSCTADSPWHRYEKNLYWDQQAKKYVYKEKITTKKSYIKPSELKSRQFKNYQERLHFCSKPIGVSFVKN